MYTSRRTFEGRRYDDVKRAETPRKPGRVRSYRGIPDTVDRQVKAVAEEMKVSVGDVVRALLEFGLEAHRQGDLMLDRRPQNIHSKRPFTLYPAGR